MSSEQMQTHNKGLNLLFLTLFIAVGGYFSVWGLGYTEHHHVALYTVAVVFGLFMAFNIGGNDVANSFGTSVGAGTLSITQALLVAAIFEVSGAVLAGGEVTKTIRQGIVDLSALSAHPMQFVYIMLAALFAAAFWLLFATKKGWPVSTTHAIVGGIVGASLTLAFVDRQTSITHLVQWSKITNIAISWVLSPVLGGMVSYTIYSMIKKHILNYNEIAEEQLRELKQQRKNLRQKQREDLEKMSESQQLTYTTALQRDAQTVADGDYTDDDLETDYYKELLKIDQRKLELRTHDALQNWVPIISAFSGIIISSMLLFKGLKHMHLGLSILSNYLIMCMIGAMIWMATFIYAKTSRKKNLAKSTFLVFSWMQVFTAAGFAFSHGSNDIANAVGPFVAILEVLRSGTVGDSAPIPPIAMLAFGVALIVGLWFIGKDVIATVGHNLTQIHPSSGFAAELSAATVVMLASTLGLPVSSTHILVGAVLGIGLVNKDANWGLMKPIALAWVITLPVAGILAGIAFIGLDFIF